MAWPLRTCIASSHSPSDLTSLAEYWDSSIDLHCLEQNEWLVFYTEITLYHLEAWPVGMNSFYYWAY